LLASSTLNIIPNAPIEPEVGEFAAPQGLLTRLSRGYRLSGLIRLFLTLVAIVAGSWLVARHSSYREPGYRVDDKFVYLFEGIDGPSAPSAIAQPQSNVIERYCAGGASRLAVLLTDANSSWLSLAHGLKSAGVPFVVTRDYRVALNHRVVLVYPTISGSVLSKTALEAIARFPRDGGTLIAQNVLGGQLNEVFGFAEAVVSQNNAELHLTTAHPATAEFTQPEEQVIRLSADAARSPVKGTYAYTRPKNPPLAVYEDGSAAVTQKPYATGRAYALGMDIGYHIFKGHNARQDEMIAATYANGYTPTLDVLLRLIRNLYTQGNPDAVTLSSVPAGKSLAALITHDIDYTRSVENAREYAQFEASRGIPATYFVQTKYVRDWNDDIFFNPKAIETLRYLRDHGMELASHGVAHSYGFAHFPVGSGEERYPAYRPFVKERHLAYNGTVLGELRVSRFLLEEIVRKGNIVSFRPGHLQHPFSLPEALRATGYRYSSTMTANMALSHLPFQLNHSRGAQAEVDVFEFPITVEDELNPPMIARLPAALTLARKLSRYGGLFVILIHPDIAGQKLAFEREFVDGVQDYAWFGSLAQFGDWWAARDLLEIDVARKGETRVVHLKAPRAIRDVSIEVAKNMRLSAVEPRSLEVEQQGQRVLIKQLSGEVRLSLQSISGT
jgi:peptidoglycan/xylan/chitin deacetylase (PgdA/CDA1 family)